MQIQGRGETQQSRSIIVQADAAQTTFPLREAFPLLTDANDGEAVRDHCAERRADREYLQTAGGSVAIAITDGRALNEHTGLVGWDHEILMQVDESSDWNMIGTDSLGVLQQPTGGQK